MSAFQQEKLKIDNMKPRISVIMSIYKEPIEWIRLAVDSILNQTYKDFEFIIVCDNPEYLEGQSLINEFANKDGRVVIINNEENIGLTKSLNKAIAISKGEFIARMDADDVSLNDRFEYQINYFDSHRKVKVCATNTNIIDEYGNVVNTYNYDSMPDISWLFLDNPIAHSSVMFSRDILSLRTPIYNEDYRSSQDFELWSFLISSDVNFYISKEPYLLYRKSANQISQVNRLQQLENSKNAHKKLLFSYLRSMTNRDIQENDISEIIQVCEEWLFKTEGIKKKCIEKILYIAFLNGANNDWTYVLKYIFSPLLLVLRFPVRLSMHLLFIRHYRDSLTKVLYLKQMR